MSQADSKLTTDVTGSTRRRLLVVVAGGAAAAAFRPESTVEIALHMDDSIFAMIENYKSLQATWLHLHDQLDEAESDAAKVHGRRPIPLIHWRHYHIGGSEIDDRRESLLQEGEISAEAIEQEYLDAKARYQAKLAAEIAWDERTGLAGKRKEFDEAMATSRRYEERLANAKPTTPAGAAALIQCLLDDDLTTDDGYWHIAALNSAVTALHSMKFQG
jgi:hypothetical protein